jgi:hypothetical protein
MRTPTLGTPPQWCVACGTRRVIHRGTPMGFFVVVFGVAED